MAGGGKQDDTSWRMPKAGLAPWNHLKEVSGNTAASRKQAASDIVDRARAEQQTTSDYSGRYPIELVQNAHDAAGSAAKAGRAWLELTNTALIVANDGRPFNERRVTALMRYGDSPKDADKSDSTEIGYKGIGFSAVFEVTDNPQIISSGMGFQLHRQRARTEVEKILDVPVERVPVRGYPLELEPSDIEDDAAAIDQLFADGAVTVIRLPLLDRVDLDEVQQACEDVLSRRTLLFLPNLGHLELRGALGPSSWSRRLGNTVPQGRVMHLSDGDNRESWMVAKTTVPVSEAEVARLPNDVWADVRSLNLAVAVPWAGSKPAPVTESQRLHVYFPTEVELGRGLIVHGDFFVDSSRKHLLTDVNCGPLNDRLAAEAGSLTASIVEGLVESAGPDGLGILDKVGSAGPFGGTIWDSARAQLQTRHFIPTTAGARVQPGAARVLVPSIKMPDLIRTAVSGPPGRVNLDFEHDRAARRVLLELGSKPIESLLVAVLLRPTAIQPTSAAWLKALGAWLSQLPGREATPVRSALGDCPVVQRERDRTWVTPSSVVRREPGIPKMPDYADREEVRADPESQEVLDQLKVRRLDLKTAIDLVLDGLDAMDDPPERVFESALDFVHKAWNSDSQAVVAATDRLAEVSVPVRPARSTGEFSKEPAWRRASSTYFDTDWQPNSVAAAIYGPMSECEFLATDPPSSASARSRNKHFYKALGINSVPHLLPTEDAAKPETLKRWRASEEWKTAWCPDHRATHLQVVGLPSSIERLDQVMERTSADGRLALRRLLLSRDSPLREKATVRCTHGWHSGHRERTTQSLDQWLLRTSAWLPVVGSDELASPDECWTQVVGSATNLMIRICSIDERAAMQLGVQSFASPQPEALERELNRLEAMSRGSDANRAWDTGRVLLRKLAMSLRQRRGVRTSPPLPVLIGGERRWSSEAVAADIPGVDRIPDLPVLDDPSAFQLARTYALARASDLVESKIVHSDVRRGTRSLAVDVKAELVATLHADGANQVDMARWLGRLNEVSASEVKVRLTYDGHTVEIIEKMHLEPVVRREGRSMVKRGTLSWSTWDLSRSAELIAQYLEEDNRRALIALVLTDGKTAMQLHAVGADQLEDARAAIEKYTPEDSEVLDTTDQGEIDHDTPAKTPDVGEIDESNENGGADVTATSDADDPAVVESLKSDRNTGKSDPVSEDNAPAPAHGGSEGQKLEPSSPREGVKPSGSGRIATSRSASGGVKGGRRSRRPPQKDRERRRLLSYVVGADEDAGAVSSEGDESRAQMIGDRGEQAVMEYEERAGREPERQPPNNPGFDIRSSGELGERIIEVKAIDGSWSSAGVGLTRREYEMAVKKGDAYYLYVVEFALDDHRVISEIRDPARRIDRYFFDDGWRHVAELVDDSMNDAEPAWLEAPDGLDRPLPINQVAADGTMSQVGWVSYDEDDWDPDWFGIVIGDRSLGPQYRRGLGIYRTHGGELEDGELVLVQTDLPTQPQLTHRVVELQLDEESGGVVQVLQADNLFADPTPMQLGQVRIHGALQRRLLPDEITELLGMDRSLAGDDPVTTVGKP